MSKLDMDRFRSRNNPRLRGYDYSTANHYFVTICTYEKQCLFGEPGKLNQLGKIAEQCFLEIELHHSNVQVDKYVVMPNHIHGIIDIQGGRVNISTMLGLYKSAVTKEIHKLYSDVKIWQTSFHDHIIRNETDYQRIWTYIEGNPAKWTEDCFYVTQPER